MGEARCSKDRTELAPDRRRRIVVEPCPHCEGVWLDFEELDAWEDLAFNIDLDKGTLAFEFQGGELPYPVYGQPMESFKYRHKPLVLDVCPNTTATGSTGEKRYKSR